MKMKMEKKTKSAMISDSEKLLYVIKPHQKVGFFYTIPGSLVYLL